MSSGTDVATLLTTDLQSSISDCYLPSLSVIVSVGIFSDF